MPALTSDRNTALRFRTMDFEEPVAASQLIFTGALIARNAAGYLVKGSTATGLVGVGVAMERVDNSAGAAGDRTVKFSRLTARFANSGSDPVTRADIGKPCFIVDDQTVAKTDGTGTRSPAGLVEDVETGRVWVRFDETLVALATA